MDFGFAAISLVLQTGYALVKRSQILYNGDSSFIHFLESSIPMRLVSLTDPILTDIGILSSTCLTSGLLSSIYQRGRGEKLHAPLFLATVVGTFAAFETTSLPMDILTLTAFQWVLAFALLISRCYDSMLHGDSGDDYVIDCSVLDEKRVEVARGHRESNQAWL
ncbi:hypothetical protein EG329_005581 [Mollisiaceae sp. DMI_Dod_QoI]|nr:hypothetical protein EG329_005581 [Helotiales sp. DMI_Dod_QoI]